MYYLLCLQWQLDWIQAPWPLSDLLEPFSNCISALAQWWARISKSCWDPQRRVVVGQSSCSHGEKKAGFCQCPVRDCGRTFPWDKLGEHLIKALSSWPSVDSHFLIFSKKLLYWIAMGPTSSSAVSFLLRPVLVLHVKSACLSCRSSQLPVWKKTTQSHGSKKTEGVLESPPQAYVKYSELWTHPGNTQTGSHSKLRLKIRLEQQNIMLMSSTLLHSSWATIVVLLLSLGNILDNTAWLIPRKKRGYIMLLQAQIKTMWTEGQSAVSSCLTLTCWATLIWKIV